MNRYFLIFVLCITATLGCRKDAETGADTHHNTNIKGIEDLTVKTIDSVSIPLVITNNDKENYVALEITGLPAYLQADFNPSVGLPNFASLLTFKSSRGVAGKSYTFKIKATTGSGIKDSFDMHVNVTYDAACVDKMVGTYNAHYECSKSGGFAGATVSVAKLNENTLTIRHLQIGKSNQLDSVIIDANCEQVSISAADQWETHYHIFSGQGYFSASQIDLTYTVELAETCTVTLTSQ